MTTVCFVRHARSTYNEEGRMAGFHDPPLSEEGRQEAALTATYLRDAKFDAAFSSPLQRALETAKIVWGDRSPLVEEIAAIRELDMGEFSGQKWTDVLRDFPTMFPDGEVPFWQLFARDLIPRQEPFQISVGRIMGFFSELARSHPNNTILVVGHKGVLEVFFSQTIGFDPCADWFAIGGASITIFQISPDAKTKILAVNVCPGRMLL